MVCLGELRWSDLTHSPAYERPGWSTSVVLLTHDERARTCQLVIQHPYGGALAYSRGEAYSSAVFIEISTCICGYQERSQSAQKRSSSYVNRTLLWCEYSVYTPMSNGSVARFHGLFRKVSQRFRGFAKVVSRGFAGFAGFRGVSQHARFRAF